MEKEFDKIIVVEKHGGATLIYKNRGATVMSIWCLDWQLKDVLTDYRKAGIRLVVKDGKGIRQSGNLLP